MRAPRRSRRAELAAALVAAGALASPRALAQSEKAACESAHLESQDLQQSSKLLEARKQLLRCAAKNCPGPIQADCAEWLANVNRDIPSAVFAARTRDGAELIAVRVELAGKTLTERLDGKPIELDPGPYTFRFDAAGQAPVEVDFVAQSGAKNRVVQATFEGKAKPAGRGSAPVAFWVLAGVGTAALASFGYFAWTGQKDYSELEGDCAPSCKPDDRDAVKTKFLIADISLGVAALAYAGAAYFYFSAPRDAAKERAHRTRVGTNIGLSPMLGGGYASFSHRF